MMPSLRMLTLVMSLLAAQRAQAMIVGGCQDPSSVCPGLCGTVIDSAGCRYACGGCATGYVCSANTCQAPCTPTSSCSAQGASCGSIWDGCAYQACGSCGAWTCDANHACQPPPPPPPPDGEQLCGGGRAYVNGDAPTVFDLLCGVGVVNDTLAVNWMGQWFSLTSGGLNGWTLQNNSGASYWLSVAPTDFDGLDATNDAADSAFDVQTAVSHFHTRPSIPWRTRSYSLDIAGRHYDLTAKQRVYDHRIPASAVNIRGDVVLTVTSPESSDGSTWTVTLTDVRVAPNQDNAAVQASATAAEASGGSSIASSYTLFGNNRTVIYGPNVEMATATKGAGYRANQMSAGANPALNNAFDQMLGVPQTVYSTYEPEGLSVSGTANGAYGSEVVTYDKSRNAQFYMNTRGGSGFSNPGTDRPFVDTFADQWMFRQPVVNYDAYWPFLAGICGLSAHVQSFVEGSFQAQAQTCFDGIDTSASAQGRIAFSLAAGGGFGCEVIVASASAGLSAGISEVFEFGSSVATIPPRIDSYVRLYSEMNYDAFFKVRVLFWTHQWRKVLARTSIFQREVNYQLVPNFPDVDVCKVVSEMNELSDDEEDPNFLGTNCDVSPVLPVPPCAANRPTCGLPLGPTQCLSTYDYPSGGFLAYPLPDMAVEGVTLQNKGGACQGQFCSARPLRTGPNKIHSALDLHATFGMKVTPVLNNSKFMNLSSRPFKDAGRFVLLQTPNAWGHFEHSYQHLSQATDELWRAAHFHVAPVLNTWDVIGFAGQSGNACAQEHMHFQIRQGGVSMPLYDPTTWFSGAGPSQPPSGSVCGQ